MAAGVMTMVVRMGAASKRVRAMGTKVKMCSTLRMRMPKSKYFRLTLMTF